MPNICEVLNHVEKIKLKDIRISVFEKYMLAGYSRVCMNMKVQNKESRLKYLRVVDKRTLRHLN